MSEGNRRQGKACLRARVAHISVLGLCVCVRACPRVRAHASLLGCWCVAAVVHCCGGVFGCTGCAALLCCVVLGPCCAAEAQGHQVFGPDGDARSTHALGFHAVCVSGVCRRVMCRPAWKPGLQVSGFATSALQVLGPSQPVAPTHPPHSQCVTWCCLLQAAVAQLTPPSRGYFPCIGFTRV